MFTTTKRRCRAFAMAMTGLSMLALALPMSTAFAQSNIYNDNGELYVDEDVVIRKLYGGIGLGISALEPDTSDVPGVDNKAGSNFGGQVMLGMDINKWLSIEGHLASLGEAQLEPTGGIGYSTIGASALAYAGRSRHLYNRRGFTGFARLGFGLLNNSPTDNVEFEQLNSTHLLLGAGLEYALRDGIGFRAEAIAFDTDAQYMQLSVMYRIGRRTDQGRRKIVEAPAPAPLPKPAPAPVAAPKPAPVVAPPVPAVVVAKVDSDTDGVNDAQDRCPNTQPGVAVDNVGCDLFTGVIEGVNFNSGSADLTPSAQGILSGVVSTLNRFPTVKLSIMAHTDSQGDSNANKQLSRDRARSVAVYLVRNGVSAKRLKAYGYGEERPIDTNETAAGRSKNRRVEFRAAR